MHKLRDEKEHLSNMLILNNLNIRDRLALDTFFRKYSTNIEKCYDERFLLRVLLCMWMVIASAYVVYTYTGVCTLVANRLWYRVCDYISDTYYYVGSFKLTSLSLFACKHTPSPNLDHPQTLTDYMYNPWVTGSATATAAAPRCEVVGRSRYPIRADADAAPSATTYRGNSNTDSKYENVMMFFYELF